jgi:hydroxyacylglutathione hydrolase
MPLAVDRYEVGPFPMNCYVVRSARDAAEAIVVDPGWVDTGTEIRLELARMGARCAAILVTHTDLDHIGGVADLAEGTGAPVYAPAGERERLERASDFLPAGYQHLNLRSWVPEVLLEGGEELDLAGIRFETLLVPGHTEAHLAFYADGCLFSGDQLVAGSVGRTDRPNGSHETLLASIRTLVDRFPPETAVYSGHGPPTTLGAELAHNPFLAELRQAS